LFLLRKPKIPATCCVIIFIFQIGSKSSNYYNMKSYFLKRSLLTTIFALTSIGAFAQQIDHPNSNLLISAQEAKEYLHDDSYIFIDMRAEGFHESHVPGAVWFGGAPALIDTAHAIADFLIDTDDFQSLMRMAGVNNDSKIVIYDGGNGLAAARLFFALELHGHVYQKIINGGFASWKSNELEISTSVKTNSYGNFSARYAPERTCDVTYIIESLTNENIVILDARSPEEFSGEEERAERSGHIPNAVNIEWRNFVRNDNIPYFKSAVEIDDMLNAAGITPEKEVVTHCQTNVRGSHAYFVLRLMGYDGVRAFEGSWSEWGNRSDTPINR